MLQIFRCYGLNPAFGDAKSLIYSIAQQSNHATQLTFLLLLVDKKNNESYVQHGVSHSIDHDVSCEHCYQSESR